MGFSQPVVADAPKAKLSSAMVERTSLQHLKGKDYGY